MMGIPEQIQACHDRWAATVGEQLKVLAVESQRVTKIMAESLDRLGQQFSESAVSVTQFGLEYKKSKIG